MATKIISEGNKGYVVGGSAFAAVHEDTLVNVFGMDRLEARKTGLPAGEYELDGDWHNYSDVAVNGTHPPVLHATGKATKV